MKRYLQIAAFTLGVSLLYTAVGQVLPQLESHPPARLDRLPSDVGPDVLAEMGEGVFASSCAQCHTISAEGGRGPDLAGIGSRATGRAAERAEETGEPYDALDYLLESLCRPDVYLVDGFSDIMPPQGRSLDGGQILAIAAFLQNLGAVASVTGNDIDPLRRFGCPTSVGEGSGGGGGGAPVGGPEEVFSEFACAGCHPIDAPRENSVGPSLHDVGRRLTRGELYESLLAPDAVIAEGYESGLMSVTLGGSGFYDRMRPADYQALVGWLAEHGAEEEPEEAPDGEEASDVEEGAEADDGPEEAEVEMPEAEEGP